MSIHLLCELFFLLRTVALIRRLYDTLCCIFIQRLRQHSHSVHPYNHQLTVLSCICYNYHGGDRVTR